MLGERFELLDVLTDDQDPLVRMPLDEALDDGHLQRVLGGDAELRARRGGGVAHAAFVVEGYTDFDAAGFGDEPLRLQHLPRHVVALRTDQAEDLVFFPVLAHERRRQPEPPARLQVRRHAEDGRGQEVHFVVHDEAPVLTAEDLEVLEGAVLVAAPSQHLVGRDRHGPHGFAVARVLSDVFGRELGLVEQLVAPLPHGDGVGRQDQRLRAHEAHHGHARDGLARATRQHDHPAATEDGAAGVERRRRGLLVVPQPERCPSAGCGAELDRKPISLDVTAAVIDGEPELDQRLFDRAALQVVEPDAPALVDAAHVAYRAVPKYLVQRLWRIGHELEGACFATAPLDAQETVAADPAADFVHQCGGHRHTREVP